MSLLNLLKKNFFKTLFTTPSHSQKFFLLSKFRQFYKYDISETDTHNPQVALKSAEEKASKIYQTKKTHFLTNGSTSGIITAVLTCVKRNDKVLIWKDAHICHQNAVKLAGAEPIFYETNYDESFGISKPADINYLESLLQKYKPKALIITSPTYEGFVSDIKALKQICEKTNTYLIVDEAHGALYPFSEKLPQSSVNIADFVVQSLHKTAGGLNPTALLHNNTDLNSEKALEMINTTSPSYPLLASIEKNINYLNSSKGRKKINELIQNILNLKNNCQNIEFCNNDDITKIVIKVKGISGFELSEKLYDEFNIEDEKTNEKSTMLLTGIGTDKQKLNRLEQSLKKL